MNVLEGILFYRAAKEFEKLFAIGIRSSAELRKLIRICLGVFRNLVVKEPDITGQS